MKQIPKKYIYIIVIAGLVGIVFFIVNSFSQGEIGKNKINTNNSVNTNIPTNNSFTGKYTNKELGVEMDVPSGLVMREMPVWQLVYNSSFPGNPEPNIAFSIKLDPASKSGSDITKDIHFLIVLYKRKLDPKTLLGNHTPFNDVPGTPLKIFGKGILEIKNIDFQKYDFYSSTLNGTHIFDLAGNLDSDFTVYTSMQMLGYPVTAIDDDNPNLLLMKQMIESLRFTT